MKGLKSWQRFLILAGLVVFLLVSLGCLGCFGIEEITVRKAESKPARRPMTPEERAQAEAELTRCLAPTLVIFWIGYTLNYLFGGPSYGPTHLGMSVEIAQEDGGGFFRNLGSIIFGYLFYWV